MLRGWGLGGCRVGGLKGLPLAAFGWRSFIDFVGGAKAVSGVVLAEHGRVEVWRGRTRQPVAEMGVWWEHISLQ